MDMKDQTSVRSKHFAQSEWDVCSFILTSHKLLSGRGTGDPHYLTFDGRRHTFNGRGDFTILEIVSEDGVTPEFSIQGRLDRVRRWRIATHQGLTFGNENLAFHVGSV